MAVRFGLIIVGDEILSGKRQDKHLARVIELLGARGLRLSWARYVGDDRSALIDVLRQAFASADVVFSTGGIGATPDDHTRQAAAAALGVPLVLHPQARALIEERMREIAAEQGVPYDPERPENRQRLQMGVFPQGARLIPNPYNRIPGFSCDGPGGGTIHFVPGFPVMAWPMIEWVLDTHYRVLFGQGRHSERSVIVFGAIEAVLTPLMERIEAEYPDVRVFSLPSVDHPEHGRHVELGVKGPVAAVPPAYDALLAGLRAMGLPLGPELVRE
ncbi:competence/damage-inducible protein A [Tepidimonas charontis]|uniref:CinA-like protein n=1 Tax=Tepidimonas charontis TaxID=2267262 RepID=A0A554XFU4_9BURK|nr:molybdopterin-binding protein [Tepidimonas charontis]TSE34695.1 CinA-like protein [Tepidimonas charontis]